MSKAWTPFVYDFGFLQLVSSSDLFPKGLVANMFMWVKIFTQMVMCLKPRSFYGTCLAIPIHLIHFICLISLLGQLDFRHPKCLVK